MRKALAMSALVAGLSFGPIAMAGAQTSTTNDPNDVEGIDNPVDENDNSGFDDWGLFGLLGLLGLAGLAKRTHRHDDVRVTTTSDPDYAARR
jgi:MYXO-CTERM domain-containing protein